MNETTLSDTNFEKLIREAESAILLFHKKVCPHCLNMKKVIEKFIAKEDESLPVLYIDSEESPGAMESMSVERVPTLCIIKNGAVAFRHTGLMNPRQLAEKYKNAK